VSIGDINSQELINGPSLQSLVIPSSAYTYGEVNRIEISGPVPAFPADLFALVIRNSATADTTTHTQRSGGMAVEVTGTRSAGSNDMSNIAFECQATGAQTNNCIEALNGDVVVDAGNLTVQGTGNYIFETSSSGFIAAVGTLYAESAGTNAIDITAASTNAIKIRNATAQIDIDNAGSPTLLFYNANSGNLAITLQAQLTTIGPGTDAPGASGTAAIVENAGSTCSEVRDATHDVESENCSSSSGVFIGSYTNHTLHLQTNATNAIQIDGSQATTILGTLTANNGITVTGNETVTGRSVYDDAQMDQGTLFTLASGSTSQIKGATSGTFTASGSTETITFGITFTTSPTCVVSTAGSTKSWTITSRSTTQLALGSLTNGQVYDFTCIGH
jgi:hypothetical protein